MFGAGGGLRGVDGWTQTRILPFLLFCLCLLPFAQAFVPPLGTRGRYIYDGSNTRFKIAALNWYGASDVRYVPGGLDVQNRDTISAAIAGMGYNTVRLPYSDQMVIQNPVITSTQDLGANTDLMNRPALDVFQAVVESLTNAGLAVIVNNHITQAAFCCQLDPCDVSWENTGVSGCTVNQTQDDWIAHWKTVMTPLVNNSRVIGVDLRNEPRNLSMVWDTWASAAEAAGNALLALNPNWLVIVEGLQGADDLSGVAARPVELSVSDRVVYSNHIYKTGASLSLRPYGQRTYSDFAQTMDTKWGYLLGNMTAPVWIGEIGAPQVPDIFDFNYWQNVIQYLNVNDVDWSYWALNTHKASPTDIETYSIVQNDWVTEREDYRTAALHALMPSRAATNSIASTPWAVSFFMGFISKGNWLSE